MLLGIAFLAAMIGAAGVGVVSPWLSQGYLAASLVTMVAYGLDKEKAGRGEWRTAENLLHLLELLGGWPGALFAQQLFRHKTRKASYQIIFWIIVFVHLGVWGWLAAKRWVPQMR
jgi:uncharacterized membrane protein YsdA (DUF1294 family)